MIAPRGVCLRRAVIEDEDEQPTNRTFPHSAFFHTDN